MTSKSEANPGSSSDAGHSAAERASNASVALARLRQKTREGLRLASRVETNQETIVWQERLEEIKEIRNEGFAPKAFYSSRSEKRQDLPSEQHIIERSTSTPHVSGAEPSEGLRDSHFAETDDISSLLPDALTESSELRMDRWKEIFLRERAAALAKTVNENGYNTVVEK